MALMLPQPQTEEDDLSGLFDPSTGSINTAGVLQYLQRSTKRVRGANQTRYDQLKEELNKGFADASAGLEGYGKTALADLGQRRDELNAQDRASLTSRGLGGSTLVENFSRGREQDYNRAAGDVYERIGTAKAGLAERRGSTLATAIGNVTDEYPDTNAYLGLVQNIEAQKAEKARRDQDRADREAEMNKTYRRYAGSTSFGGKGTKFYDIVNPYGEVLDRLSEQYG